MSLSPGNDWIISDVAEFLITHDIHVEEGMALVEPLLEKYPENALFLYAYGVGLFKLEKYQEAIEVLERSWEMRPYYDHKHFTLKNEIYELLDRS
jgi:tetratricopeptide (TPR) repeat protein